MLAAAIVVEWIVAASGRASSMIEPVVADTVAAATEIEASTSLEMSLRAIETRIEIEPADQRRRRRRARRRRS